MHLYTVTKISKLGERDPKYGQTYWAEVRESDFPIMFNSSSSFVSEGQALVAEEQEKKISKKGSEYLRLKKVKLAETEAKEPTKAEPKPELVAGHFNLIMRKLNDIHNDIKTLKGEDIVVDPDEEGDWLPTDEEEPMPEDFLKVD